jgi:hypothetical protein
MADKRVNILINARDNASATFKRVAKGMAVLYGGKKAVEFVKGIIDMGDAIGKASQRIGTSAESWQKLTYAAERSGASAGDVETAFKKMSSTIFDAGRGLKSGQDALAALGLNYDKISKLSPEQQFAEIAKRLNLVTDATDKAAIAQDLFGRSGTMLIPMLGNYEQLGERLKDIGGVMSNESVKASEDFNDAVKDLSLSVKGLVHDTGLIEWLASVAKGISNVNSGFGGMKNLAETVREQSVVFNMLTGGLFAKTPVRVKPKGEMAYLDVGKKFHGPAQAGEIAAKAAEVAAGKNRAAEVADAAAKATAKRNADEWDTFWKSLEHDRTVKKATQPGGGQDRAMQEQPLRFTTGLATTAPAKQTADNTAALLANARKQLEIMTQLLKKIGINVQLEPAPL